jgi:4-hydroxy-2-oxoheptanedioate aldolase
MNLTLQTIPSPVISEILSDSKLDGVVLDTEHGCFNNETLYSCIQVITLSNKKCFVRLTDFNKQLVRMCLDAGVDGLIFSIT